VKEFTLPTPYAPVIRRALVALIRDTREGATARAKRRREEIRLSEDEDFTTAMCEGCLLALEESTRKPAAATTGSRAVAAGDARPACGPRLKPDEEPLDDEPTAFEQGREEF
jgi:hypothetical protein